MINPIRNNNCDSDKCRFEFGEVRVLPTGPDSNAILCFDCFISELQWRRERNKQLAKANWFNRPKWTSLKVYRASESKPYQPKTGAKCSCKPGQQRDNCPNCEGTGMVIDFARIRGAR